MKIPEKGADMPNVKITIIMPAAFLPRIQAAKIAQYGYKAQIFDPDSGEIINNPVSVQDFLLATRVKEEKEMVKRYEVPRLAIEDRPGREEEIDAVQITITTEIVP